MIRIVFTGDIAFSQYFSEAYAGGCLCTEVQGYLREADHVVVNVESPLTKRNIDSDRILNHASDPATGEYLKDQGMRIWCLANNHIMDCEAEGIYDTLQCAVKNGCNAIGAGQNMDVASTPLILDGDVRVGLLCFARPWRYIIAGKEGPGAFTWDQESLLRERLEQLRRTVDWVVLVVHGGDEYNNMPMPYTRRRYRRFLEWGADIVVAHHPHVVQNYERVGNKIIFYSLGNFIFDTENQREFKHTDIGMLLGIDFQKESFSFDSFPIHIDREQGMVIKGEMPAIFTNIGAREYARLWPLEARYFYDIDLRKRMKLNRQLYDVNPFRLLLREIKVAIKREKDRTIQLGRVLSMLGLWRMSQHSDVIKYLRS